MKEAVLVEVGERRVYFRDVKPYHAPGSLADLRGPTSGRVFLPKTVWWAPGDGWIDIDEPGGTSLAYRVVITEGQPENQIAVLNAETLKKIWGDLVLPERVRVMWETKFSARRDGTK